MSQSVKNEMMRRNEYVVAARKIESALDKHHSSVGEITAHISHLAQAPLTVVVLGEFSAGKSSFLNRLLQTEALPVAVLPRTATLTRLVYANDEMVKPGEVARVEIERNVGGEAEVEVVSHEEFVTLQRAAKVHDIAVVQDLARIREVRVFLQEPLLSKLQLVDTPGFNHDQAMDDATLSILDKADIVFWITDAMQPAKQTEFEKLKLLKERGKRIWLIVNKGDVNVSDKTAWEESRASLQAYFDEIGFLDFFESKTVELVSCKEKEDFWGENFDHTKARLGNEIFNLDVLWSARLVDDEWGRLSSVLQDEGSRYSELQRRCGALRESIQVDSWGACDKSGVVDALRLQVMILDGRLSQHSSVAKEWANKGIPSMTAFVMDYTREPLFDAFVELSWAYEKHINAWRIQYLTETIAVLEKIYGILPRSQDALRAEALTLVNYYRLLQSRLSKKADVGGEFSLPALDCTSELFNHLLVKYASIDVPCSFTVEQDGVLPAGTQAEALSSKDYRLGRLLSALERDFLADIGRFTRDPAYLGLVEALEELSDGASERLTHALGIWSEHAPAVEAV